MYKIFFSSLLLWVSTSAYAITLNEALVSAYNNDEELKKIREEFLGDLEAFPQALARFLPDINASITNQNSKSKTQSNFEPNSTGSNRKIIQKSISLEQSLFNGGADLAGLKAAQSSFRTARGQYYSKEQDLISKAIEHYVKCYSAEQKYIISDTSVDHTKKQLEAVEEKFNLGEATRSEVASARAQYSSAEAKKLKAFTDFQKAKADFIKTFGIEPNGLEFPPLPNNLPSSFVELKARALATNPGMLAAKHSVSARKSEAFAAKANLLPKVKFSIKADKSMYNPQGGRSPLSQSNNNINVTSTLNATIPIYSNGGAEYSKARHASNKARLAAISYDTLEKDINSSCIATWEGFIASKSATEAAAYAEEAAQMAYEGTLQEEMVGSKTIIEALKAEVDLKEMKIQKVDTDVNYILTAYQLKSLQGELTAKSLKLPVKYFEPEQEFKKIKMKIIGF